MSHAALPPAENTPVDARFMRRVLIAFAALAVLSAGISAGGKVLGPRLALAGHTEDLTLHEIVIANNVIAAPANVIRFEEARRDGVAIRLDLYWHWPEMSGYSAALRGDFNNLGGANRIVFATIERRTMSRDMSGRLDPIYSKLLAGPGRPLGEGIEAFGFNPSSGYGSEELVVARGAGLPPFVARCLTGAAALETLAPCERDIQFGDDLSLTYRFARDRIGDWKLLDETVRKRAQSMLRRAG